MAKDQDDAGLLRQDVVASGDAYIAGRDLIVNLLPAGAVAGTDGCGEQGVRVGSDVQVMVNVFGRARTDASPGGLNEFRADLLALVDRVDEEAVSRGLPERLVPGGDVLWMTRTVRLLGGVRQSPGLGGRVPDERLLNGDRERAYALAGERDDRGEEPPSEWGQVAAAHERLVVLGDPGMGKSWLLRAEAHRLAAQARRDLAEPTESASQALVPLAIRAGVLARLEGRTLAEAVSGYLVAEGWLPARSARRMRHRIDGGGMVLLIDALDEVPARGSGLGTLQRVTSLLRGWAESCTGTARCVVTSRLAGYAGPPVPAAREAELLPFELEDIRDVTDAWDLPGQAAVQMEEWLAQPAVAAMARVPLLLALMCSLAAGPGRRHPLPRTRAQLYGAVVWQFLSGAHRGGPGGSAEEVGEADRHALLTALSRVAFTFAESSQGWVDQMPYSDLVGALRGAGDVTGLGDPAAVVLDRLVSRAGVLVPAGSPAAGEQDYLFLHRTIAEYLVALHLAQAPAGERMRVVTAHQWFDPEWVEVIPMLGTLLAVRNPSEAQNLASHFLTSRPDPFHRALDNALRIICGAPDPDRLLDPAASRELHRKLVRLLKGADPKNRLVRTLAAVPAWPHAVTSAILELATDTNRVERCTAARALTGPEGAEFTAALLTLTTDTDTFVRQTAIDSLAGREGAEVTAALLTLTSHADQHTCQAALSALAGREGAEVTTTLLTFATDTDTDELVRQTPIHSLAGREGAEVTAALLTLITDSSEIVRWSAANVLCDWDDAEVTAALLAIATHAEKGVGGAAVRALAGREGAEVISALLTLGSHADEDVRWEVAYALWGWEDAESTAALLTLATDTSKTVREVAAEVLADREGAEVTAALLRLTTDAEEVVRQTAIRSLADREGAEVTATLLNLAADTETGVDAAAVRALGGREGTEITVTLLTFASDADEGVRAAAARALAGREGAEVTAALLTLASDADEGVRAAAARALAGREGAEVTAALLTLATDIKWHVREEAMQTLARRHDPAILDRLCRLSRRWRIYEPRALRWERRRLAELADKAADHLYPLLTAKAKPKILRRLGQLTR